MSGGTRLTVAIVGGGFSGTLTAVQLARLAPAGRLRILLVEHKGDPGPGVAYSTQHERHLLNVPAGRLSALKDQPDHFHEWLVQQGLDYAPGGFVPRRLYGRYLRDLLATATRGGIVKAMCDEVTDVEPAEAGFMLRLSTGHAEHADAVVLAAGFPAPAPVLSDGPGLISPWDAAALGRIPRDASVLLLGTGLTMVDTALALMDQGHTGSIAAVSRRGLLPTAHSREPVTPRSSADCLRGWDGRLVTLVAEGGGNGHGVGMCQWGALGRARAGASYQEILSAYFPGTELRRLF